MKFEGKKYLPVKEYAELNEITVQAVYQKIRRGNLGTKKIGSFTLVEVV